MTATKTAEGMVNVGSFDDLKKEGNRVISVEGRVVLVIADGAHVYAVDNRCPHMGFPLQRGTVKDGILTCHWHHAKFDLSGGCTFDPFADDVAAFRVEVRDGVVWLDPTSIEADRRAHWSRKLDEGLEQNIRLVLAKSVIGLTELNATTDLLRTAALAASSPATVASNWSCCNGREVCRRHKASVLMRAATGCSR